MVQSSFPFSILCTKSSEVIYYFSNDITMEQFEKHKQLLECQITFCLETSGGQSSNLYLNVVHGFNTNVNQISVAA
jgi:hypothetical protein